MLITAVKQSVQNVACRMGTLARPVLVLKSERARVPILQVVVCSLLFATQAVWATEPWADVKFAAKDGLELWLDAGREAAAREAAG